MVFIATIGIRLLPQEKEELAAIARRTDTTISQILREQIRNYINSHGGSCAVAAKETYREIGTALGLTREEVRGAMHRQHAKERKLAAGYILRPKGRPRKEPTSEEVKQHNELVKLRMQVELLRNFLFEAGRR